MNLSTAEILVSSIGTGLTGGAIVLLGSKVAFLKKERWRGPRVIVCLTATIGAAFSWAMQLLDTIFRQKDQTQPRDSVLNMTYGLMILIFGYLGTLKRFAAWSRINRTTLAIPEFQVIGLWLSWSLIALAMIQCLVFPLVSVLGDRPLSLILVSVLFSLTILSELVVWFILMLGGQRIGIRSITKILEITSTCVLITYLVLNATQEVLVSPMYAIYLSCGLLALTVIVECAHPGAFPQYTTSTASVPAASRNTHQCEKPTRQATYLSIHLDSSSFSDFASNVFREAKLEMPEPAVGGTPATIGFTQASDEEVGLVLKNPSSSSGRSPLGGSSFQHRQSRDAHMGPEAARMIPHPARISSNSGVAPDVRDGSGSIYHSCMGRVDIQEDITPRREKPSSALCETASEMHIQIHPTSTPSSMYAEDPFAHLPRAL